MSGRVFVKLCEFSSSGPFLRNKIQFLRHLGKRPFLERWDGTSGDVGGVSSSLRDMMLSVPSLEKRTLD